MMLPGALADADQELAAFLHQGLKQGAMGLGQQRQQAGNAGVGRHFQGLGQVALALGPFSLHPLEGLALRVDGLDGGQQLVVLPPLGLPVLGLEQGQQFAVMSEFFPQAFDKIVQLFSHVHLV